MDQVQAVKKLKLNVTNIKSSLISSNKTLQKLKAQKVSLIKNQEKEQQFRSREGKLESAIGPLQSTLGKIKSFVLQGPMSIFDKIKEFLGLILLGMLVNNLPAIIKKLQNVYTKIEQFFNSAFIKGLGKIFSSFGKFVVTVAKEISSFTSIQKSESEIKETEKILKDLNSQYDDEEKNLRKYYDDLLKENGDQGGQRGSGSNPSTSGSPGANASYTPSGGGMSGRRGSGSNPSNRPIETTPILRRNKGGTITSPKQDQDSKKSVEKNNRSQSLPRQGETGKERRARESVNYFASFNQAVKQQSENTQKDNNNVKLFEDMTNNFKEFSTLMEKMKSSMTPPPPPSEGPGAGPGFIQMDGKLYEADGGQTPSSYKSSNFGWRWGRNHNGVDYAHPTANIPVSVLQPGVASVGFDPGGWGNYVTVKHTNGAQTLYGHLSKVLIQNGQKIDPGTVIGNQGSTGRSTGPHVHFEYRPGGPGTKAMNGEGVANSYFRFGGNIKLRELKGAPAGVMSVAEIAQVAREAGFSEKQIPTVVAIALAESGGNPRNRYTPEESGGTDNSYGLWQINMIDKPGYMLGAERRRKFGLRSNEDLYNPSVNAKIAYLLSGGSNFNAWTTYTKGNYKTKLNFVNKQLKEQNANKKGGKGGGLNGTNVQPVKPVNKSYTKISSSVDSSESQSVFMIARQVVENPVIVPIPIPMRSQASTTQSRSANNSDLWMM